MTFGHPTCLIWSLGASYPPMGGGELEGRGHRFLVFCWFIPNLCTQTGTHEIKPTNSKWLIFLFAPQLCSRRQTHKKETFKNLNGLSFRQEQQIKGFAKSTLLARARDYFVLPQTTVFSICRPVLDVHRPALSNWSHDGVVALSIASCLGACACSPVFTACLKHIYSTLGVFFDLLLLLCLVIVVLMVLVAMFRFFLLLCFFFLFFNTTSFLFFFFFFLPLFLLLLFLFFSYFFFFVFLLVLVLVLVFLVLVGRVSDSNPKTRGSNPVRSTRKTFWEFFGVNILWTRCGCTQPPCVHARIKMTTCAR